MEVLMSHRNFISAVALVLLGTFIAAEAAAVVGMPLTPVSYAGVARRSVRRAVY
jgi:hypothetical protein